MNPIYDPTQDRYLISKIDQIVDEFQGMISKDVSRIALINSFGDLQIAIDIIRKELSKPKEILNPEEISTNLRSQNLEETKVS